MLWIGLTLLALQFWPLPESWKEPNSSEVHSREGVLLFASLNSQDRFRFEFPESELSAIKPKLLCLEDQRFDSHPGVDPLAILRATVQNFQSHQWVSGASTITMQLARLLEPRSRSLEYKIHQALRALQLEWHFSKDLLLKRYLERAPYGRNVEGLETAAQLYFQKSVSLLNINELAYLFLLPQRPRLIHQRFAKETLALRNRVLERWESCSVISTAERKATQKLPLPDWNYQEPRRAMHFSSDLLRIDKTGKARRQTTLSHRWQVLWEKRFQQLQKNYNQQGIDNVSMIIADNKTGEVRVAVGNFLYDEKSRAQKFSTLFRERSVGSTLKPLIASLSIDQGDVVAESLLLDVPMEISHYRPSNHNGRFAGLISLQEALTRSLNVPFVGLLKSLGLEAFLARLTLFPQLQDLPTSDLGLSLAVGGVELSPIQMTEIYLMLANDGKTVPLVWDMNNDERTSTQFVSAGSAHLVQRMLRLKQRPELFSPNSYKHSPRELHWKTGTSQHRKDAWAVGFDRNWTVTVWLGNLDSRESPHLTGRTAAAPLLFEAFDRLKIQSKEGSNARLEPVEVCTHSGYLPNSACPHRKKVWQSKTQPLRTACPFHRHIEVDERTGWEVRPNCRQNLKTRKQTIMALPSALQAFWRNKKFRPALHPQCQTGSVRHLSQVKIHSPRAGTYIRTENFLKIPLRVESSHPTRCFLDTQLLQQQKKQGVVPLELRAGTHQIYCTDIAGQTDTVEFQVD